MKKKAPRPAAKNPVQAMLQKFWRSEEGDRDEPLTGRCLHEYDPDGGFGGQFGCRRPATSNRLLCDRHAHQHDRVKRDRARKKATRTMQRRVRRVS